ncbi:hypothetical protein VCHC50A2_3191A, partial [Vibrio cholerae HC-50A2]
MTTRFNFPISAV